MTELKNYWARHDVIVASLRSSLLQSDFDADLSNIISDAVLRAYHDQFTADEWEAAALKRLTPNR